MPADAGVDVEPVVGGARKAAGDERQQQGRQVKPPGRAHVFSLEKMLRPAPGSPVRPLSRHYHPYAEHAIRHSMGQDG